VAGLAQDPAVINWVHELTRRGLSSKQIVAASAAGELDWPGGEKPLGDGTLAACRAAIHHLEVSLPSPRGIRAGQPRRSFK
jgi:hypothetical protein